MAEQRYQAVLAVIADGLSVSQVADKVGVSRQTLHAWLARYEFALEQPLLLPLPGRAGHSYAGTLCALPLNGMRSVRD